MKNKYVWIVTFVGEADIFVVTSAEKAYQMLYTYAKKYYADSWLIEELEMLSSEYKNYPNHFGLEDMGFAKRQEVDNIDDFEYILENMN